MKRFLALLLVLLLPAAALADPLLMAEDLAGTVTEPYYEYSYRYPRVDESDPRAPIVNNFLAAALTFPVLLLEEI